MRILIFGDSNTFGTGPMKDLSDDPVLPRGSRWVDHVTAALSTAEVIVEGLPGRTTVHDDPIEGDNRNGLRLLPALIDSHRPVDLLIIALGTNDLKSRFGLLAQDVALGVKRLAMTAQASGHVDKILLVSPPPPFPTGGFEHMFAGARERGAGLSDDISGIAMDLGASFLDAGQYIECDPLDGIHFGPDAHATLGGAVAQKIREITP